MPSLHTIVRATRAKTLPIVLGPVAVGIALARAREGAPSWGIAALALTGAAALHLGANAWNDYHDERAGVDGFGRVDRGSIVTASGMIGSKQISPRAMRGIAIASWGIAATAGTILAALDRPWVLVLGLGGAALAYGYVAGLRYGYRGLGPVGVLLAYGPLASLGGWYTQTGSVTSAAVAAGVTPGLITAAAFVHADLLHHRGDATARKRTPAVILGPEGALVVSGVALTAAYVMVALQAAFGPFGARALVGLIPAPAVAYAWVKAARDPIAQNALGAFGAALGGSVALTAVLIVDLALA